MDRADTFNDTSSIWYDKPNNNHHVTDIHGTPKRVNVTFNNTRSYYKFIFIF